MTSAFFPPTSKLPRVGTSIFAVMSRLAAQHGAINLGQGFPDFPLDEWLVALVHDAMQTGHNQYAPMEGLLALREQIAAKTARCYGFTPDPATEITVTSGATEAIYAALAAVLQPGDEVIVLEPCYDCYLPAIQLNGGVPVPVPLRPTDYAIDWSLVADAITPRTRVLMLNSPHNPTGAVMPAEAWQRVRELIQDTNILIISDEVYEHLIFDGQPHASVLREPDLRARSFVISSFGKTFHATGWKTGYCVAPARLTAEFRKVHQFLTFSGFTPVQHALATYLRDPAHYEALPNFYQQKRDLFGRLMQRVPLRLLPSHGTYFQLASYAHLSQEADVDFATRLTREAGVTVIPASPFYHDATDHRVVRFCFAKKEETLEAAVARLASYFGQTESASMVKPLATGEPS